MPAVPAVVSLIALLAGACSGGADRDRPFTPAGDAPAPVTSAGAVGAGPRAGAEVIQVGPGMRVDIEWPAGLDPGRQKIIKAFSDTYLNSWKAVTGDGTDTAYLTGVQDEASRDAYAWVHGFLDRGMSARGTAKLYALRVASVTGRGAQVDACVDESGVRVTDAATGEPIADQPEWTRAPASVYLQVAAVRRGDDGVWRVKAFQHASHPHPRAKECRR